MEKYKNTYGVLSFSIAGNDYVSDKGDIIELPDGIYTTNLVNRGYITPVNNLPAIPEETPGKSKTEVNKKSKNAKK
ncbi:MAG: hypothetical protein LBQ74_00085 [Prevotella sp.]|jgi:hypothetical protein|nr:hypothetical protein [Prevotella sp.]